MNWADNTIIGLLTQIRDKPSGSAPSGDAAVTDVALGKTFDSATAGAGATGTSTKNATVPNDAPIQPPQAFVDAMPKLVPNINDSAILDLSGIGITAITYGSATSGAGLIASYATVQSNLNTAPTLNLSNNSIDTGSVDGLLALIGPNLSFPATLNLSGGTNAAPTLPVFVIDFNNLDVGTGNTYGSQGLSGNHLLFFANDFGNLSATTLDWTGGADFASIGTSDTPTKQQIIDKLVALGGGKITDLGGLKIQVSPTDHALEPLGFSGMTGSSLTQGNNNIGLLRASGWTVTTN